MTAQEFLFQPCRDRRTLLWSGVVVLGAVLWCLARSSADLGVTWDEAIYIPFSDLLRSWWNAGRPLDAASLDIYWNGSRPLNPHPPLLKIMSAASSAVFGGHVAFPLEYRLPHHAFAALGIALSTVLLAMYGSWALALLGAAFAFGQPRVWGDLMIGTSDGISVMTWAMVALSGWALENEKRPVPRRFLWGTLLLFLAAGTGAKVTAFLACVPLGAYWLCRGRWKDLLILGSLALVSLALLEVIWVGDWGRPGTAIRHFLTYAFQRKHIIIATFYGGRVFPKDPPWHYFDMMGLVVTPLMVVMGGILGMFGSFPGGPFRAIVGFGAFFWIALMHLPGAPRHDAVRQFVSFYPLLGLLAAAGVLEALRRARGADRGKAVAVAALLAVSGATLARAHPFELSYYNFISGGLPGAERRGMELTYYFDPLDGRMLAELNGILRPGDRVALVPEWTGLLSLYQSKGRLRRDVSVVSAFEAHDVVLAHRRRSLVQDDYYAALPALAERKREGVSLVKIARLHGG